MSTSVSTVLSPSELLTENAVTVLHKRYLWHNPEIQGRPEYECDRCFKNEVKNPNKERQYHETIDEFFHRVSMGNPRYYGLISQLILFANSPTLFNMGTEQGTLSACFKFDVQDSMVSIMEVATKAAMVQKFGGGVGYTVSALRPKNARIKTTHGKACGPVEVLRMYQAVSNLITQGGKRDGAQMGILHCDHPDIREFIHMKDEDPDGMSTFNISVAITDDFMRRAIQGDSEQSAILDEMVHSSWTTGDPGVYFIDAAERGNPTPWLGELTGTNPCGEVCLLDNEACNLASLNLAKFVAHVGGVWDILWDALGEAVEIAVEYLDDILDQNTFPDPAITEIVSKTRKLGLGPMGWADALALMEIHYDSDEAVRLGSEVMEFINLIAHRKSEALALEKGGYPGLEEAPKGAQAIFRRNATLTCIAPTGSISLLAGCSGGIEPHFAQKWMREMGDGTKMEEEIPVIQQLRDRGSDFVPHTALEIAPEWHVKHLAAFQSHTDLAVSKTINMPPDADESAIRAAWIQMWQSGCKGGTIYRTGSRENEVLVASTDQPTLEVVGTKTGRFDASKPNLSQPMLPMTELSISPNGNGPLPSPRKALDDTHDSVTHKFVVGGQKGWIHAGLYNDGTIGEVFLDIAKQGSTVGGLADVLAICVSVGLQYGVPVEEFVSKFRQSRFEPSGMTRNPEIPTATSVIDYLGHWLEQRFLETPVKLPTSNGMACPDCGNGVQFGEGCEKCVSCGWSRC